MSLRFRFLAAGLLGIFLSAMLLASTAPPLVGSYRVTENSDLGSQVRLTLELNFLNPTDRGVSVKSIGLRSIHSPGHMVTVPANLTVQSHSKSQITLQYLLPKKDFSTWAAGPQQQFVVGLEHASGKPTISNILLRRTK